MLSEEDDLNQKKLLSSTGNKYLNYIYFSDPGPKNSRVFFCPWKMTKNIYEIKQHWTENYPLKCFPKRLIYIKTNIFLYLIECNVVRINVFTLELCLNIVIRNGKTSFWFFWLWSQELFLRLNKTCKTSTE